MDNAAMTGSHQQSLDRSILIVDVEKGRGMGENATGLPCPPRLDDDVVQSEIIKSSGRSGLSSLSPTSPKDQHSPGVESASRLLMSLSATKKNKKKETTEARGSSSEKAHKKQRAAHVDAAGTSIPLPQNTTTTTLYPDLLETALDDLEAIPNTALFQNFGSTVLEDPSLLHPATSTMGFWGAGVLSSPMLSRSHLPSSHEYHLPHPASLREVHTPPVLSIKMSTMEDGSLSVPRTSADDDDDDDEISEAIDAFDAATAARGLLWDSTPGIFPPRATGGRGRMPLVETICQPTAAAADGKRGHPSNNNSLADAQASTAGEERRREGFDCLASISNIDLASRTQRLVFNVPIANTPCKCQKKTQCLKLYCSCFQAGKFCDPRICACRDCQNDAVGNVPNGPRPRAIAAILRRRLDAFEPRTKQKTTGEGCACKRSRCLKKYCDCYAKGAKCTTNKCSCENCGNSA